MFDPHNPNDLQKAHQYEDELFAWAKQNPHVGKGMSVEVLDGLTVCCEGRVLRIEWHESYNMYFCEVLIGGEVHYILDACLRPSRGAVFKGGLA